MKTFFSVQLILPALIGVSSIALEGCATSKRQSTSWPTATGSATQDRGEDQVAGGTRRPERSPATPIQLVQHTDLEPEADVEQLPIEPRIIGLPTALSIAGGQNPQIAFAVARYTQAYARLEAAQKLWLPSIRAGISFNHHDGNLQASDGRIVDVDRSSLQSGLGVRAVGAGTPAVPGIVAQFHATDAFFQPKIEAHSASAERAAIRTTTNDTLLATALAHLELLRTAQLVRVVEQTEEMAQQLADLTASFANTGQGPEADADRARTELVLRRNEVYRAREEFRVAGARLAELLNLDATVEIQPQEATVVPVHLVAEDVPLTELVALGLSNRPELAEAQHLVCEAVDRYRREKYAPLLPSVLLGVSQSTFGGGLGSEVDDFHRRFDFDAVAVWELRNLGFGDRARVQENRSRFDQARAQQVARMDRVAREITEASEQVRFRQQQIELAESAVRHANDSHQRNLVRIRQGQGLPIEVLQSIQALDQARREYLRTIVDYNQAQFRLQRALGWPIPSAA